MLMTFIKLPFFIKTFVLSIFEWLLKAVFTVVRILEFAYLKTLTIRCRLIIVCALRDSLPSYSAIFFLLPMLMTDDWDDTYVHMGESFQDYS